MCDVNYELEIVVGEVFPLFLPLFLPVFLPVFLPLFLPVFQMCEVFPVFRMLGAFLPPALAS
jgi:hypothetical protein